MVHYFKQLARKTYATKRTSIALLVLTCLALFVTFHLTNIKDDLIPEGFKFKPFLALKGNESANKNPSLLRPPPKGHPKGDVLVSDFPLNKLLIIFPSSYRVASLKDEYQERFGSLPPGAEIFNYHQKNKYMASPFSEVIYEQPEYQSHNLELYHSHKNLDMEMKDCNSIRGDIAVEASPEIELTSRLASVLDKFRLENSQYYQDLVPFIGREIDEQLAKGIVEEYWFRLAGSSVWLEQYGVHYMISRLVYSREKVKDKPFVSLLYVQLFDEDWNELRDVHLILPSNDPSKLKIADPEVQDQIHYKEVKFPSILPVAHYINDKHQFYGPEDPRILLVKNKLGYEEPTIFFNANHRKIGDIVDEGEGSSTVKFDHFRSMFMCWPWQYQLGKVNVDGLSDNKYDYNSYCRVHEIRRRALDRGATQKNWTPFINYLERYENEDSDAYVYFIYRWSNLEVLKCQLTNLVYDKPLECEFVYRMDPNLAMDHEVGAMRGGTALINIRQLLEESYQNGVTQLNGVLMKFPREREIWIGFPRAHITDCGCGLGMYRPNLAVITKNRKKFKVRSVSSFLSLGVDTIGWNPNQPSLKCDGLNVYIPNGISSWSIRSTNEFEIEDYMTMTFSLSDSTCHVIHIRGLLTSLLRFDTNSTDRLFQSSPNPEEFGFNNENLDCAVQKSHEFCQIYGEKFNPPKEKLKEEPKEELKGEEPVEEPVEEPDEKPDEKPDEDPQITRTRNPNVIYTPSPAY